MRLVFMGTPDFSVPALEALVAAGHEIAAVYCQPPRRAGRGQKTQPSPVQKRAENLGLEVHHPLNFRSATDIAEFAALKADIAVVVAYGLILPQAILDAPRLGCLNIHASLLPRWRGAAPIHRAVLAGDAETGISIMQMEAGLDTGPVLMVRQTAIAPDETTASLHDRLASLGAEAIVDALASFDNLTPVPQDDAGATYAAKIEKSEARVNWSCPAIEVDRLIRGLSPFPGAWCDLNGERLKLLASHPVKGQGAPGEVIALPLIVACGKGAVEITGVQRAGKGAMDAETFLRGSGLTIGSRLG